MGMRIKGWKKRFQKGKYIFISIELKVIFVCWYIDKIRLCIFNMKDIILNIREYFRLNFLCCYLRVVVKYLFM